MKCIEMHRNAMFPSSRKTLDFFPLKEHKGQISSLARSPLRLPGSADFIILIYFVSIFVGSKVFPCISISKITINHSDCSGTNRKQSNLWKTRSRRRQRPRAISHFFSSPCSVFATLPGFCGRSILTPLEFRLLSTWFWIVVMNLQWRKCCFLVPMRLKNWNSYKFVMFFTWRA